MRIAIAAEICLPKKDGVTLDLDKLVRHLRTQSHEALLFGPSYSVPFLHGFPVARAIGFPIGLYPGLHFSLVPPHLLKKLYDFRPDAVFVVDPFFIGAQIISFCHVFLPRTPLVVAYCTNVPLYTAIFGYGHISAQLWRFLRMQHALATVTVCRSQSSVAELRQRGWVDFGAELPPHQNGKPDEAGVPVSAVTSRLAMTPTEYDSHPICVWPGGIDTNLFRPQKRSPAWRQSWSYAGQKTILLYVGRISWEKNLEALLDAYALLDPRKFHLVIVGEGPATSEFRALLDGRTVTFTSWLTGEDLATAYASADIFVFPSVSETFGNVVVEAMASGLPVVAFESEGVRDSVLHDRTGMLVETGDIFAFAQAIERVARSESLAGRMGEVARQRVTGWTVQRSVQTCEAILCEAISISRKKTHNALRVRLCFVAIILLTSMLQNILAFFSGMLRLARHGQIRANPSLPRLRQLAAKRNRAATIQSVSSNLKSTNTPS